jgi:hypothetical protein
LAPKAYVESNGPNSSAPVAWAQTETGEMKTTFCIATFVLLAAVALAACEFPYYPEYADVFGRYDEVTPEMAIAGIGAWPGRYTVGAQGLAPLRARR